MNLACKTAIAAAALWLSGCTIPITPYSATYDNVQLLKASTNTVAVSPFSSENSGVRNISVRGSSLDSPYDADLVNYIETALKLELEKAGILNMSSDRSITAVIEENDIDTGSAVGSGVIAATFTITDKNNTLYRKRIGIDQQWESSFMGALAIPRAAESYPKMVQKLLNRLFSDGEFVAALNR